MVKLIALGTSSTFPFPRTVTNSMSNYSDIGTYEKKYPLHDDIICSLARRGGKERRTRSCLAIVTDFGTILLDAGPDILYQLKKFDITPDAVFITHDHSDAAGGLNFLKGPKIYQESRGTIGPGKPIEIFGIKVTPFRVNHAFNVKTCGFKVDYGTKSFAYMSDVANLDGVEKWIRDCDFIFADGSNLDQNLPTHLSIITQLETYKEWGIKKVIFTHIGHKTLPHEELQNYCRSIYSPVEVAFDGLRLKLD